MLIKQNFGKLFRIIKFVILIFLRKVTLVPQVAPTNSRTYDSAIISTFSGRITIFRTLSIDI